MAVDAVLLQNFIEQNLLRQKSVTTNLLDILGAFDRLHAGKLIETLIVLQLLHASSFLGLNHFYRVVFFAYLLTSQWFFLYMWHTTRRSHITNTIYSKLILSKRNVFQMQEKDNFLWISYIYYISQSIASHSIFNVLSVCNRGTWLGEYPHNYFLYSNALTRKPNSID